MPEFKLSIEEGLHVPLTPFCDVSDKEGTEPPIQIDNEVPKLNVGVTIGLTVTVNTALLKHCPAIGVGVNVYTPELCVFTTAGFHVPLTPLSEREGKVGTVPPAQIFNDVPKLNTGVIVGVTVTDKLVGFAH